MNNRTNPSPLVPNHLAVVERARALRLRSYSHGIAGRPLGADELPERAPVVRASEKG
jgi:hypothetical protein